MRRSYSLALATWLLERALPASYGEALAGDLVEAVGGGERSHLWMWAQVVWAMGGAFGSRYRSHGIPLLFSVAWSLFLPLWVNSLWQPTGTHMLSRELSSPDWPFSALLELAAGLLPALTFVWVGLFAYLLRRGLTVPVSSPSRLLGSFSLSLSVLLVATISLSTILGSAAIHSYSFGEELYLRSGSRLCFRLPVAMSLFSAILAALPQHGYRMRTRQ